MDDTKLGRLVRVLRSRRGWRQVDVAERIGISASTISAIELGRHGAIQVKTLRQVAALFGLSYEGWLRGLGADEDRLLDEGHATLLGACARWLIRLGWEAIAEVTYSEFGERGSIDILAWHAVTQTLLVIEIKTELASIEATLRKHDEKVRLAAVIAGRRGWRPAAIGRLLVLPEDRVQRRHVAAHEAVLKLAYPVRTRAVKAWCEAPSGSIAGLMFLADSTVVRGGNGRLHAGQRRTYARRQRIRVTPPDPPPEISPKLALNGSSCEAGAMPKPAPPLMPMVPADVSCRRGVRSGSEPDRRPARPGWQPACRPAARLPSRSNEDHADE
ncbi:MAG: helix-turn-helix transcriptional regulator [Candidatus Limnocylindrales bacterium]